MKRSWIREANKYGVYEETREGFRIYRVQDSTVQIRIEGDYQITEIKRGLFVAIRKDGTKLYAGGLNSMWEEIELQKIKDYCNS